MARPLHVVALVLALATLPAPGARALEPEEARHLLARTGPGPTRAEIEALLPLTRAQAVERVVSSVRTKPTSAPEIATVRELGRPKDDDEKRMFRDARIEEALALKAWWANEMLTTTSPFTEHMVLFWSNHFTTSLQKVKVPALVWQQHLMLRANLNDFRAMLHGVVDDPAMLVYLDGARNKASAPNENFARELLELFTLGEGHYGERDVKEAARALTGTSINRRTGAPVERRFQHDRGQKTFLGVTGELDGDDVVEILLQQPRTAELVVEKLWRDLVSPTPDARAVKTLAAGFRKDWRTDSLLRAMLSSDAFWAREHRGVLVKSPVDLVVGAARSLELSSARMNDAPNLGLSAQGDGEGANGKGADRGRPGVTPAWITFTVRSLGQDLFDPPNVKGWPGGERWITTLTLPDRERLAREAVAATKLRDDETARTDDPKSRTSSARHAGATTVRASVPLSALLLPLPPTSARPSLEDLARDPAFQLK